MDTILLSMKNKSWQKIKNGGSFELRKFKPKKVLLPFRVVCCNSHKKIVGEFIVDEIIILKNYAAFVGKTGIDEKVQKGFNNNENVYAWHIQNNSVFYFDRDIFISEIGFKRVPQSYQHLFNFSCTQLGYNCNREE